MIFIIRLYQFLIMPVTDLFVNLYIFLKNIKIWKKHSIIIKNEIRAIIEEYVKSKSLIYALTPFLNKYAYVSDFWNGYLNFNPCFTSFKVRNGSDCSGWAFVIFRILRKMNLQPKLFLLTNGLNLKSFHVVVIVEFKDKYLLFNVNCLFIFDREKDCLDIFTKTAMILSEGKPFIYDNIKIYRWL